MAEPLSADALLRALRLKGLRVVEHRSWRTHNRNHKGPFGPVHGVMLHHTVSKGTASSVELCYNGHSQLPGPLYHGVIAKDGTVYLIGHGRANHAGMGDDDVHDAVVAEKPLPPDDEANTDGNRSYYGLSFINLGDGKDTYSVHQIDAGAKASAAICEAHGWDERSVLMHSQWQPGKIDPYGPGFPGADGMRARVRTAMDDGEGDETMTMPTADEIAVAVVRKLIAVGGVLEPRDIERIWEADVVPAARPPHANPDYATNPTWQPKYALLTGVESSRQTLDVARRTLEAVKAQERTGLTPEQLKEVSVTVADAVTATVLDALAKRLES